MKIPNLATCSASPLRKGERIKVRSLLHGKATRNPHLALSLEKGEARDSTNEIREAKRLLNSSAFAPGLLVKILASRLFALGILIAVGVWLLVVPALIGRLGANPLERLLHQSGEIAIWTLGAVLALSPLRVLFPRSRVVGALNRHRRAVGVSACVFGLLHFGFHILYEGDLDDLARSLSKPFIWYGLAGLSILVALALTSNNWSIRALGGKNWKLLHRLGYVAAALLIYHQSIAGKGHWHIARWLLFPLLALQAARVFKILLTRSAHSRRTMSPNPHPAGSYFRKRKTGLAKSQQKVPGRPSQLKQQAALRARSGSAFGAISTLP